MNHTNISIKTLQHLYETLIFSTFYMPVKFRQWMNMKMRNTIFRTKLFRAKILCNLFSHKNILISFRISQNRLLVKKDCKCQRRKKIVLTRLPNGKTRRTRTRFTLFNKNTKLWTLEDCWKTWMLKPKRTHFRPNFVILWWNRYLYDQSLAT
jgi:hypothetical protein